MKRIRIGSLALALIIGIMNPLGSGALAHTFDGLYMDKESVSESDNDINVSDNDLSASYNKAEEFEINSVNDFLVFAENCRKNSWSKGRIVKLNSDIDLSNVEFGGIPSFSGYFMGNNHTIKGMNITNGDEAMGLFRYLEIEGKIADLTVTGFILSSDSRDLVGGIVGVNSGTIINSTFAGQIRGINVAGGIVGLNGGTGKVIECVNKGFITSQTNVGGVAGINRGIITDSINNGDVNSDSSWIDDPIENDNKELTSIDTILDSGKNIGGIAGWSNGIIATCTNKGTVGYLKTGENVGGIVGCHSGSVFYCTNEGRVFGKQDVGGIVGQFEPTIVIKDIQEIKDEVDKLHDILDKSTDDMDKATDKLTNDMNDLNNNSNNLNQYADKLTDEGLDVLEENVDVANDFFDRADYVTNHMSSINTDISTALDDLDKINKILDEMSDDVEMSQEDKDKIKSSRDKIDKESEEMRQYATSASDKLTEAQNIVQESRDNGTPLRRDDVISLLVDASKDLANALRVAAEITGYVNDIADVLDPYVNDTSDALSKDLDKLEEASDEMYKALTSANDVTGAILNYLNSQEKLEIINFSSSFDQSMDDLQNEVSVTLDAMDKLNKDASTHSDILEEDMRLINDQFNLVTNLIIDRISNFEAVANGDDIIVDMSENDKNGEMSSSVIGCENRGNVDGTANVGGIAGTIGIEATEDNAGGLGSKYEVSAVMKTNVNNGFITVKNKNAGGIVGLAVAGYIADSVCYGGIISEEGNYIGGIAGNCKGIIDNCRSLAVLSGSEYLGGIAGVADDVKNCFSMPMIKLYKGRIGAIMGAYQSDDDDITVYHIGMSDHISQNYFASEELLGIDSVSYTGVAEAIDYDQIKLFSRDFNKLKIYFVDEDYNIIDVATYKYGYDLTNLTYPNVDTVNKTYAEWDKPEERYLTSNLVLRSVVVDNVTIIASKEVKDGKAIGLAEGLFTKDASISVEKIYDSSIDAENKTGYSIPELIPADATVIMYNVAIHNGNISDGQIVNVRLLQEYEGNTTVYMLIDGTFTKIDATNIGSYWQIAMSGDNACICVVTIPSDKMLLYCIIGGVIAALVIVLITVVIVKKKKKSKSKHNKK